VLGLRGTGSHDFAIEDTVVAEDHSFDIFMGLPHLPGPSFVAPVLHCVLHMGAVAVGIAQGAVDDILAHATSGKKRLYARVPIAESPIFHTHLGRAETSVRAARAALREVSTQFWAACEQGPQAVPPVTAQVMATLAWVSETTAASVDMCYRLAGGSAARDASPLQGRFRDIHTYSQHGAAAEGWYTQLGASFLGHPVTMSF
jgi:alkylation response protein AidB-like acyl-CoA dehydrogenase